MKKTAILLLILTGTVLLCVALNLALQSRLSPSPEGRATGDKSSETRVVAENSALPAAPPIEPVNEKPAPAVAEVVSAPPPVVTTTTTSQPPNTSPATPTPSKKPPIRDPVAREALGLVGIDRDAEAYWFDAINDSSLSSHERQDLIEDLNEEGFSDPKNLSVADLPLVLNRIALIEQLAPDAMDKVNADAFAEAYKDLVNMYGKIVQR